jgi:hypothetical protein
MIGGSRENAVCWRKTFKSKRDIADPLVRVICFQPPQIGGETE